MIKDKLIPKRRFKEFENAEAWEQHKVGDLGNIVTGSTPSTSDSTNYGGNYLFVRPADIKGNRYVKNTITKLSKKGFKKGRILKEGSTLFVSIGSTIGKVAQIKEMATTNQQINSIEPSERYNDNFIYSLMKYKAKEIKNLAATQAVPIVNKTLFSEVNVIIPSDIEEQIKIGTFFKNLDNLIALHQRKLTKLKELKLAYLLEMFPEEGEKYPKRRFAGFTYSWEQCKLLELTSLITKGTTPLDKSGSGDINFIKIENIDSSSNKIISTAKITMEEHDGYLKRSQLQENDILFSIAGTLGRVATVNKEVLPANTNQALAIIRLKRGYLRYITTYLKGKAVSEYIKKNPTIGAQPNLSLEQVGNLEISLPKDEEQIRIGDFFHHLDNLIAFHQRKLEKLGNIKKAYLNEMFV